MTNELAWYKLLYVKGLGTKGLSIIGQTIQDHSLQPVEIFSLGKNEFYRIFKDFGQGRFSRVKFENFQNLDDERIYNSFQKVQDEGITILPVTDERYPSSIKSRLLYDAPAVLFCEGYLPLLKTKNISIVGSRSIDDLTLTLTKKLAGKLANSGYNVVSGYAKGVDTNAHLGALEANGTTLVVLSLGLDHLTIKREFKEQIDKQNTLFISQFKPIEKWSAGNAMTRNKVVCGLSDAVIVIASGPEKDEKGRMSGTFAAGKSAIEMGLPVFVLSPKRMKKASEGNELLIQLGGIEFQHIEEVLDMLKKGDGFIKSKNAEQLRMFN